MFLLIKLEADPERLKNDSVSHFKRLRSAVLRRCFAKASSTTERLRDFSGCNSLVFAKTPRSTPWPGAKSREGRYQRDHLRYASDTTDEEWKVIAPHLPPPADCGRTSETDLREVVNSIFYIAQTGCQWRLLPEDFPPYTTVQRYFYAWRDSGVWQTVNGVLLMDVREAAGREASPTAGVIDSEMGTRRPNPVVRAAMRPRR